MLGVALVLGLSACGASHKVKAPAQPKKATKKHSAAAPTVLTETARLAGAPSFSPSLMAHPGDSVEFRTYVPGTAGSPPQMVALQLPAGPAPKLTVIATTNGQAASLSLTSATGKPLTLLRLRYQCTLPPAPTFCPAKLAKAAGKSYHLRFFATHQSGVLVSAIVGPVALPAPKLTSPGTSVLPPYTAVELLRARPANAKASTSARPATPSVTVSPGELVTMYTRVTGSRGGAAQAVTVTINQGPAQSLTVSAQASGGPVSRATVKSANGSPISLVLPGFNCYVPPTPTFCPATKISTPPHRYRVTFMAAPGTATIELTAKVSPG